MAEKVWSQAERESAAEAVYRRSGLIIDASPSAPSAGIVTLQCEFAEAVEIIEQLEKFEGDAQISHELFHKRCAFLQRNKEKQ